MLPKHEISDAFVVIYHIAFKSFPVITVLLEPLRHSMPALLLDIAVPSQAVQSNLSVEYSNVPSQ